MPRHRIIPTLQCLYCQKSYQRRSEFCSKTCFHAYHHPLEERVREKIDTSGDGNSCHPFTGAKNPNGYGHFGIGGKTILAHRWVWEQANGPIPDGIDILHRCDNPSCCRLSHLFDGDADDNYHDMVQKGRYHYKGAVGERNTRAKVTVADVIAIRASGATTKEIAEQYGLTMASSRAILSGKTWKNIDDSAVVTPDLSHRRPDIVTRSSQNAQGERVFAAKLTDDNVREIRQLIADGLGNSEIASCYGVTKGSIWQIRKGKTWRHVT